MKAEAKRPAASTASQRQHFQQKSYPLTTGLSSFIQIGELLLLLAGQGQSDGWQQFEQLLRQFYEGALS